MELLPFRHLKLFLKTFRNSRLSWYRDSLENQIPKNSNNNNNGSSSRKSKVIEKVEIFEFES